MRHRRAHRLLAQGVEPGVRASVRRRHRAGRGAGRRPCARSRCPHAAHALPAYYLIAPGRGLGQPGPVRRRPLRAAAGGAGRHDRRDVRPHSRRTASEPRSSGASCWAPTCSRPATTTPTTARAQRVRTLMRRDFDQAFADVDLIATPASPTVAFAIGERVNDPWAMYACDMFTVPVNLAGLPGDLDPLRAVRGPAGGPAADRAGLRREPHPGRRPRARAGDRRSIRCPPAVGGERMSAAAWEPVIGLEIHVQLNTATKMFCACEHRFGAEPNTLTCPLCLGHPGVLPVINQAAVEKAIQIGLALNCEIAPRSQFPPQELLLSRQPQGATRSASTTSRSASTASWTWPAARIGITRAHLEEDAAKLVHAAARRAGSAGRVLAGRLQPLRHAAGRDRHRARPALAGAGGRLPGAAQEHAADGRRVATATWRRDRCAATPTCRCGRPATGELGTKTELKNMNSFKFLARGYGRRDRAARSRCWSGAGRSCQETLHYDPGSELLHARFAPRRRPTTTATSPSPTWCRWRRPAS